MIKLIAFDLDGTLSQHKTHLPEANKAALRQLAKKYRLVMAGAGLCMRIFDQMEQFPIDIIGSYGMQEGEYNKYYALDNCCKKHGIAHDEVIFVGDDYGMGGNNESIYQSDFGFITIDNYLDFPERIKELL